MLFLFRLECHAKENHNKDIDEVKECSSSNECEGYVNFLLSQLLPVRQSNCLINNMGDTHSSEIILKGCSYRPKACQSNITFAEYS